MYEAWIINRIKKQKESKEGFVRAVLPSFYPQMPKEPPNTDNCDSDHNERGVAIIEWDSPEICN